MVVVFCFGYMLLRGCDCLFLVGSWMVGCWLGFDSWVGFNVGVVGLHRYYVYCLCLVIGWWVWVGIECFVFVMLFVWVWGLLVCW